MTPAELAAELFRRIPELRTLAVDESATWDFPVDLDNEDFLLTFVAAPWVLRVAERGPTPDERDVLSRLLTLLEELLDDPRESIYHVVATSFCETLIRVSDTERILDSYPRIAQIVREGR